MPLSVVAGISLRVLPESTHPNRAIRYIDIGSVDSQGRIKEVSDFRFETAPSRARRVPVAGDTIVSTVRTYLKAVAFIERPEKDLVCSTGFAVLSPSRLMHPKFLFYWARSTHFIDEVCARSVGVSYPALRPSEMAHLPCAVPPIAEQRVIADFLDRRTAAIDALLEQKLKLLAEHEERRRALIDRYVMGKSGSQARRSSGTVLGEIPAHWHVNQLMHLTPTRRPIMYGIVLPGPNVDDGVPIVKSGNCTPATLSLDLLHRTTREIEAGYARSRVAQHDIVYAIRGSVGMSALVPEDVAGANLTQDAARIAPGPGVNPRWLLYVVQSPAVWGQLEAGVVGATVKGINIRDLKRPFVPVPPRPEQDQIADYLDQELGRSQELEAATMKSSDALREYRQALITAAVTGHVDVTKEPTA